MLKFLIENLLLIIIGLIIITQLIIPSFTNLPYFWLFKSKSTSEPPKETYKSDTKSLKDEVESKVKEFKEVKTKVDNHLKEAQEIKNKTNI